MTVDLARWRAFRVRRASLRKAMRTGQRLEDRLVVAHGFRAAGDFTLWFLATLRSLPPDAQEAFHSAWAKHESPYYRQPPLPARAHLAAKLNALRMQAGWLHYADELTRDVAGRLAKRLDGWAKRVSD